MTLKDEMVEIGHEVDEILSDCRRYLTEFGSVEPGLLVERIDSWRSRVRAMAARNAEVEQQETLQ